MSKDIANVNDVESSDWYLKQLTELNLDVKEIPNLIKQQLEALKNQYEIKPYNSKYYIFTNSPNIKVDDLREQILRLVEVSCETKKILEDYNVYAFNKSIKATIDINSNLPPLSTYNLIIRNEILQQIEKDLNERKFVAICAFAGTGKTTLAIKYGREQIDDAKKIVRFIKADSAYKIAEAYIQFAKEFGIYTIGEKGEDITRLIHENIAKLNSNILFIFDNVEAYKDIELYLKSMMNILKDKVQVIITTKNNNLSDDIKNIKLPPFNKNEAIAYLKISLGNRLNDEDINDLIEELGNKDEVLPYSLSKAVAYLKENILFKVKDYINYLHNSKDEHAGTILLLEILEKSPIAWQILQYSAYLDPDFISIDIFKELFLLDKEKLQEPIKKLESLSLMNLVRQDGYNGLQLHGLVQSTVKRYVNKHKEHAIDEQKICTKLTTVLDNLFPPLTNVPGEDWENAKIFYPHIIKILNDNIRIDKSRKAILYQKLGNYNEYILCKFTESLEYDKKALKIFQELYQQNHPDIAQSLNNIGLGYYKLGYVTDALKYYTESLKMFKALYQRNHPKIANSFNNIGASYQSLGNIPKGRMYFELALKIYQTLYKGNHPDIALSLNNVGVAYETSGNITRGLKYYKEALEMFQALYQGNHPKIVSSLNSIGFTYEKLGNISKGLEHYKEALKIGKVLYKGNHPKIADSFTNIGWSYLNLNNISEGLKYFELALKMYKTLYKGNHVGIANSLANIGIAYESLGNIFKATKYYKEASKMKKELY